MPATALAPGGIMGAMARRAPVGVVACITSYNFPIVNMVGKIAPALAMGNTVVVRPAGQDPLGVIEIVQDPRGGRLPARRREHRDRIDARVGPGAGRVAGRRHGELHRVDGRRHADRRDRRPGSEAPAPRARRQGCGGRVRGRRSQDRDRDDRLGVGVPLGADLHRADPRDRPPLDLRPAGRGSLEDGRRAQGRRPAREGHDRRAAHHRGPPAAGPGLRRSPASTRAARSWPVAHAPGTWTRAGTSSRR